MTLKEFVTDVLQENNITADADKIIEKITEVARQRAVGNCAAISDEEIRDMVINNADLINRIEEEKANKKKLEEEKAKAEKLKKEQEKERNTPHGEQTALF